MFAGDGVRVKVAVCVEVAVEDRVGVEVIDGSTTTCAVRTRGGWIPSSMVISLVIVVPGGIDGGGPSTRN